MSANVVKKTIGATEYTFTRLGARPGLALRAKLLKVVGPVLLPVIGAGGKDLEAKLGPELLGAVGKALAENLDSAEVVDLVDGLMASVLIGGRPGEGAWDMHFAGNYGDLDTVIVEAVKHQGFFGRLGELASRLPS